MIKLFFILQIIFMILTFICGILVIIGKLENAGLSICCMAISLAFGNLYNSCKTKK